MSQHGELETGLYVIDAFSDVAGVGFISAAEDDCSVIIGYYAASGYGLAFR